MFVRAFGTGNSVLWSTVLIEDSKLGNWTGDWTLLLQYWYCSGRSGNLKSGVWAPSRTQKWWRVHIVNISPMLQEAWHMSHYKNRKTSSCPDHPIWSQINAYGIS
jgi:hypothetical protein